MCRERSVHEAHMPCVVRCLPVARKQPSQIEQGGALSRGRTHQTTLPVHNAGARRRIFTKARVPRMRETHIARPAACRVRCAGAEPGCRRPDRRPGRGSRVGGAVQKTFGRRDRGSSRPQSKLTQLILTCASGTRTPACRVPPAAAALSERDRPPADKKKNRVRSCLSSPPRPRRGALAAGRCGLRARKGLLAAFVIVHCIPLASRPVTCTCTTYGFTATLYTLYLARSSPRPSAPLSRTV